MFRLQAKQPVSRGLLMVVRDRLDSAMDLLLQSEGLTPETIHGMRKRFKRLKSLFRLIRDHNQEVADLEIHRYRELGQQLSPSRDHDVLEQTLIKLQFMTDDQIVISRLESLHQRLLRNQQRRKTDHPDLDASLLRNKLLEARAAAELALNGDIPEATLIAGYLRTYKNSRKLWKHLPRSHHQEDWHEWRKRVKDDLYQTQLLGDYQGKKTRTRFVKNRLNNLRHLADLLGYDHDLQNLSEIIETLATRPHFADEEIQLLIDKQRHRFQRECLGLGQKLYCQKSSEISRIYSSVV